MIFDLVLVYGFGAFEINHEMAGDMKSAKSLVKENAEEDEEDDDEISGNFRNTSEKDHQTHLMHLNLGIDDNASASDIILNALIVLLDGEVNRFLHSYSTKSFIAYILANQH